MQIENKIIKVNHTSFIKNVITNVLLFFYMIILFLIFIIQFSVACACLATNENQQNIIARETAQHRTAMMNMGSISYREEYRRNAKFESYKN
ncbi:Tetraspanin-13 [Armadillidium vulgare]|nr:Tetraspanin-13 [Armadillidium vulgare]